MKNRLETIQTNLDINNQDLGLILENLRVIENILRHHSVSYEDVEHLTNSYLSSLAITKVTQESPRVATELSTA